MKLFFCLVLFIVGVQSLTDEQKEKMEVYSKQCKPQTGITPDLIEKGRNGEFVDDLRLKKQILCIMKKVGMVNEDGDLVEEDVRRKLKKVVDSDEEIDQIAEKCVVQKSTPEETAFRMAKCLYETKPTFSPID